tara:strand:- start:310 stop:765 length:456 start_codon:yes stop_codon:yes gene_type:complete
MDYSKEISMLKEENKKLKDQIERERYEHQRAIDNLEDEHYQAEREQEDDMELKQFCLNVHNQVYGTNWNDEGIVDAFAFDEIIKRMEKEEQEYKEEIKKLKEENKKLKEEDEKLVEATIASYRQVKELKEEIEKYKDPQEDGEVVIGSICN